MRIRQVKPAFWTDARIAALPAPARLFYIGLWMVADDAGWLRWDPSQIANELYISPETVSHHLRHIFAKTGSANRTEASAYAHRHGLLHDQQNYKNVR